MAIVKIVVVVAYVKRLEAVKSALPATRNPRMDVVYVKAARKEATRVLAERKEVKVREEVIVKRDALADIDVWEISA